MNTDSGGSRINGAEGCDGDRAQELNHSGRQRPTSAGIVFNRFTIFPLGGVVLLALLLRRHQRAILRILRLQRGYQPGLLCKRLLLFCSLMACQLQPVRQQRVVTAKKNSHQQQKHQAAAGDLAHPAVHDWPQVQTVFSTSRRVISPFHSLPSAYFQRLSSPHAPAGSPTFNFFSIVEPINAYGPTLYENE